MTILFLPAQIYAQDSDTTVFYPGMSLERNKNHFRISEFFLRSSWKTINDDFFYSILESRGSDTTTTKKVLLSAHAKIQNIEISAGHRFLPGLATSYLSQMAVFSGLQGLPAGRRTGSAWAWYHFENLIVGTYALEDQLGTGLSIGQNRSWQINYHAQTNTGSLTYFYHAQNTRMWLDLQKTETTTGFFYYKYNTIFQDTNFSMEAKRQQSDDHFYEKPIDPQYESVEPQVVLAKDRCGEKEWMKHCKIVRNGKNGQFFMKGKYVDTASFLTGGQDRPQYAVRVGSAWLHTPLLIVQGKLLLGVSKTRYKKYINNQSNQNAIDHFSILNSTAPPKQLEGINISQERSDKPFYFEDSMALIGYEITADHLVFGWKAWFPKYASKRSGLYMSVSHEGWALGWSFLVMDAKLEHPYDFFWMHHANPDRSSLRFYEKSRGAFVLFAKSKYFYITLAAQSQDQKINSWMKLQWQAEF